MAIQGIRRAPRVPPVPIQSIDQPEIAEAINKNRTDHFQLAQQVTNIHNRIQTGGIVIGNGLTSIAVALAIPMPNNSYTTSIAMGFNSGGWWITGRSSTGFTLNWVNATAAGNGSARYLLVE